MNSTCKLQQQFEEWSSQFDHDSDQWEDMGRDQIFLAGMQAAIPPGHAVVPIKTTREIEDAIAYSRNLKACELWEDIVNVARLPTQEKLVK